MTWNYRLCKYTYKKDSYEEIYYEIREIYYNENGDICAVTENPAGLLAESPEEMKEVLKRIGIALEKDIVDLDTIKFADM